MPGKVNPVIPEVVNQIAFEVIGNDVTVSFAAEAGQLQLNAFEPIIAHSLFKSVNHLRAGCLTLAERCVNGITANREHLRRGVEHSIGIVTALNPYIGYANATEIAQQALVTGDSVYDLVLAKKLLTPRAARPDPAARSADAAAVVHSDHRRRRAAGGDRGAEGNRVRIDRRGGIAPSLRGAKRTKQFILSLRGEMDCFALLAMTADLLAICPRMPG